MKLLMVAMISLPMMMVLAEPAIAQTIHLTINIPFDFHVGNQSFPAGHCDITSRNSGGAKVLLIFQPRTYTAKLIQVTKAERVKEIDRSYVLFRRYQDEYFLGEVWQRGNSLGHSLPKNNEERELASKTTRTQVILMANQINP